jgi:hypothetical protein
MELTAHVRGDRQTEAMLQTVNRELAGDEAYRNPLVAAADAPGQWVDQASQQVGVKVASAKEKAEAFWQGMVDTDRQVKEGLGKFFKASQELTRTVVDHARQDWQVIQSAAYMPEITQHERAGQEDRLSVIQMLKDAASRS